MVLRPYGFEIWDQIRTYFDSKIKKTGHRNAYFPTLIPESLLRKEAEHFEGFTPEVFWVTKSGTQYFQKNTPCGRPPRQSFTIRCRDGSEVGGPSDVVECVEFGSPAEIKSTKPFIRSAEFLWQEGHTAHASEMEAEKEVMDILLIYRH